MASTEGATAQGQAVVPLNMAGTWAGRVVGVQAFSQGDGVMLAFLTPEMDKVRIYCPGPLASGLQPGQDLVFTVGLTKKGGLKIASFVKAG